MLKAASALRYGSPAFATAVSVSVVQLAFCDWNVSELVDWAGPEVAMVNVSGAPVRVPPPLVVTVTVCPAPRPVTVLPRESVTLT